MPTNTPRLNLSQPVGSDPPSQIRVSETANLNTLDNAVTFSEGTISARPAAGLAGRVYYATDTLLEYVDTGSSWLPLATLDSNGHVPPAQLPWPAFTTANTPTTASVGAFYRVDAAGTVTLPTPTGNTGQMIGVWNNNSGICTVSGAIQYLGGSASSLQLGGVGSFLVFQAFSANWWVVSGQQDSGWVALSLNANYSASTGTGFTPAYRFLGNLVYLRGAILNSTGGSGSTPSTVPVAVRPASTAYMGGTIQGAAGLVSVTVQASGVLTCNGSWPNSTALDLGGAYYGL